MTRARRVVIVGGGITGLAAAHYLQESGAPVEVTVLEKAERLGGCIFTERRDGFVMEHGADVFLARKPHAVVLCAALGLMPQVPLQRRAYVCRADGLRLLPQGFSGLVPVRLGSVLATRLLSPGGKARLLLERWIPPSRSGQEESVKAFFVRRYGREVYARIIAPLLGGLTGADPAAVSLDAQLPHLRAMEQAYGSLMRATGCRPRRATASGLCSLDGGLGTMIEALRTHLGASGIRTGVPVRAIRRRGSAYTVHAKSGGCWQADAVLVAAPAYEAARMLAPLDDDLAEALGSIRYGATITVQLAYRALQVPRALDASGYIVAPGMGRAAVASTWSSAKLAGRAPADHVLLRIVLGRKHSDAVFAMDDERLIAVARAEVRDVLGVVGPPLLQRVQRWHRSLPHYVMGHQARCARIEAVARRYRGLHLAGAFYHGAGIPDCIQDAQRAGQAILSDLELNHA